jgi:hypothetical protein
VVGIGSGAGAFGVALLTNAAEWIAMLTHSYFLLHMISGLAYLVALGRCQESTTLSRQSSVISHQLSKMTSTDN